jgi:hypothetical protein
MNFDDLSDQQLLDTVSYSIDVCLGKQPSQATALGTNENGPFMRKITDHEEYLNLVLEPLLKELAERNIDISTLLAKLEEDETID